MKSGKVRVLVVDDSALVRGLLSEILGSAPDIEVVGAAPDPLKARELIKKLDPDVLTLDVEMPHMDGLSFLEKLMALRPMPVVMVSSLTRRGADVSLRALEAGAVDIVAKPTAGIAGGLHALAEELQTKVRAAAAVRPRVADPAVPRAKASTPLGFAATDMIVAIGASTGGVAALQEILPALPPDAPGVLVTQHMPPLFTERFAERMDGVCAVRVAEARDGQRVLPGHVYVAPGGLHLRLSRSGASWICRLDDGPPVSGHRPSVDALFHSVAAAAGANAVGVILTGMGRDGADGLVAMRRAGARTFGQDQQSCVVYGMPQAALRAGAVEQELPLNELPTALLDAVGGRLRAIRV